MYAFKWRVKHAAQLFLRPSMSQARRVDRRCGCFVFGWEACAGDAEQEQRRVKLEVRWLQHQPGRHDIPQAPLQVSHSSGAQGRDLTGTQRVWFVTGCSRVGHIQRPGAALVKGCRVRVTIGSRSRSHRASWSLVLAHAVDRRSWGNAQDSQSAPSGVTRTGSAFTPVCMPQSGSDTVGSLVPRCKHVSAGDAVQLLGHSLRVAQDKSRWCGRLGVGPTPVSGTAHFRAAPA